MTLLMRSTAAALKLLPNTLDSPEKLRASLKPGRGPVPVPRGVRQRYRVEEWVAGGQRVVRLTPRPDRGELDLVYLPGGGYVEPMIGPHWWIVEKLIRHTGARVTVPSYLLAPEHTAVDSLPLLDAAVDAALEAARDRRLILAGDSAGGGLALAQAMRLRESGPGDSESGPGDSESGPGDSESGPGVGGGGDSNHAESRPGIAAVVLLAPWVDVTLTNPDARAAERCDPSLRVDALAAAGTWWAGERGAADPTISPLFGDLAGLPPLTLVVGGRDLFRPDVRLLAEKARAAGTDVALLEAEDGFHVYPGAYWTSEARTAYRLIAERVTATVGIPSR